MRFIIVDNGLTVKDFLYRHGFSRVLITRLKASERGILVNDTRVTVRFQLRVGDVLDLAVDDSPESVNELLVPRELPLDILYEDDSVIAVNKPPEMPTHPSHGHFDDTLANALAFYFAQKNVPFVFRAVNRLDRNTSGVVLCAKNSLAAAEYSRLMQDGKIRKAYTAVLNGRLEQSGEINAPIKRLHESIILRGVCDIDDEGAKAALTRYETVETIGAYSVVKAEPVTGRTHQLRVHFASQNAPIVGDGLYGTKEKNPTEADKIITRHALHADELIITKQNETITIKAKLPDDMRNLIDAIKH